MSEFLELLLRLVEGFAGFRFIFSSKYRKKVRDKWRNSQPIVMYLDIFGGLFGITVITVILILIIRLSFQA